MKRINFFCLLLTGILGLTGCSRLSVGTEPVADEGVPIYFFHDTACGSCDGTAEFLEIVSGQIASFKEQYPYKLIIYNVFKSDGSEALHSIFAEYGINKQELSFPTMLINGNVYEGLEAIEDNLKREYLRDAVLAATYFYREDCQECVETKEFMDNLPETITVDGMDIPFRLIRLNSREGNNGTKIRELFVEYGVPEEKQMVPSVFIDDFYLAGKEDIEKNLIAYLEQGYGLCVYAE